MGKMLVDYCSHAEVVIKKRARYMNKTGVEETVSSPDEPATKGYPNPLTRANRWIVQKPSRISVS